MNLLTNEEDNVKNINLSNLIERRAGFSLK